MLRRTYPFFGRVIARFRQRMRDERGQVLVIAALSMVVLLGGAGLVIDVGVATSQRRAAQSAADAAALSGAVDLPGISANNAQAVTDATNAANQNLPNGLTNPQIVINSPPVNTTACPTNSHAGDTASVQVCITATAPSFLLGILHAGSINISAHAIATGSGSLGTPPIAVLDPSAQDSFDVGEDPGFSISGKYQPSGGLQLAPGTGSGQKVTVTVNGPIYSNSVADDGEEVHANDILNAPSNHVAGQDQSLCGDSGESCGQYTTTPTTTDGKQLPDPLAYLTPPTSVTSMGTVTSDPSHYCSTGPPPSCIITGSGNVTVAPGVWNNLEVRGSGTLTLSSGTYVITGSLQLTGTQGSSNTGSASGQVVGNGVSMFFGCSSASAPYWQACTSAQASAAVQPTTATCPNLCQPGGFLNLQSGSGSSKFTLSAPTSGPYQGLLVFYDRNNYSTRPGVSSENQETFNWEIVGSSNDSLKGTVYTQASNGWLVTQGSSVLSVNSCFVANSIGVYGPANFTVTCSPANNAIPSSIPIGAASLTE